MKPSVDVAYKTHTAKGLNILTLVMWYIATCYAARLMHNSSVRFGNCQL